ncbi:MAG: S9 family peptidase [Salinivirgaceae bacterium]|nr:S9 family peptidase [Salinivirgaceae bacterium]
MHLFKFLIPLILCASLFSCTNNKPVLTAENYPTPPDVEKKDCVLTIHNDTRVDPYFWMRLTDEQKTAEIADEQTQKVLDYLNAENAYTNNVMADTDSLQTKLYAEIVGRIKQDDQSVPYVKNGYWYYSRYEKGKEYPIYCRKKATLEAEEEIYLDVNKLAEGHSYYSATGLEISPNNNILAFGEDKVSRRIYTIRFLNLETGEFYKDQIENTTAGGAWANDNKTFFYTTKDKVSLLSDKIWRHKLGTLANKDVKVYEELDPSFYIGVYKSKSDKYIMIFNSSTLASDYYILEANNPEGKFKQFTPREGDLKYTLSHYNDKFYIVTNWDAVNFRLMETPINRTNKVNWKEVIPHRENVLLEDIEIFKNHLVILERENVLHQLRIINQDSKEEHYLKFEEEAYVTYFGKNAEFETEHLQFEYASMTTPFTSYSYNMNSKDKKILKRQEVVGGHNPEEYETKRLFAPARDGELVPISLVYKKGYIKNGKAPLILYAYGSYGNTIDPYFSSTRLSLLDRGYVWAIAHIRGGQAKGRQWYDDGKMLNKINTFNDYIDCADFLTKEKYSSHEHIYGYGGSAGGLLMGAVANMAPDKFNGIIAAVPFVDVVSTMLDESIPLTTNEFDEWGNPKNKESYNYMLSYSPYDQVKAQYYPHLLITTGYFDSQVQYWEPAKWLAKLRDLKTDKNLLIMKTNMEAGHGGASGRFQRYKEVAFDYSFFMKLEGIKE